MVLRELPKIPSLTVHEFDPLEKCARVFRRDVARLKNLYTWTPGQKRRNPAVSPKGRVLDWDHPEAPIFPNHTDLVIVGGGVMGCAAAYFVKQKCGKDFRIVVVEKDFSVRLKVFLSIILNCILKVSCFLVQKCFYLAVGRWSQATVFFRRKY